MLKYDISFIYKKVNELLYEYDRPYKIRSADPSVDIWRIAQEGFGVKIEFAYPWTYGQKHAVMEIIKNDIIIKMNKKDKHNHTRCRFNIAHELGHLIFSHVAVPYMAAYKILKYNIANEWGQFFNAITAETNVNQQASADGLTYFLNYVAKETGKDQQALANELAYLFSPTARQTGEKPRINYNIAHEWGRIVYNDYYYKKLTSNAARHISSNPVSKVFRLLFLKEWGREELADHFAANLLVPIYRFQHYLDKPDKELAGYFKVDEKCIKKRRKEFGREMDVLTAAVKPLSTEENANPGAEYAEAVFT